MSPHIFTQVGLNCCQEEDKQGEGDSMKGISNVKKTTEIPEIQLQKFYNFSKSRTTESPEIQLQKFHNFSKSRTTISEVHTAFIKFSNFQQRRVCFQKWVKERGNISSHLYTGAALKVTTKS